MRNARSDTAGVVRLIAGFSELRHLLEQGERHLPLADELVERYLEIQRVRFADRLTSSARTPCPRSCSSPPTLSTPR